MTIYRNILRYIVKDEFLSLKNLRKNEYIIIQKFDKGNYVVILDKTDYLDKMENLLNDPRKFILKLYLP